MSGTVVYRLRALRNSTAFRSFAAGRVCSHTGNGAHTVAASWLVWQVSGGAPLALGLVPLMQFLPQLLGGAHAGALVDRVNRRRAMLIQQGCALVLAAAMALLALSGAAQLWSIYLITLGVGVSTAFSNPLQQALLSEMVQREDRQSAVALNSLCWQGGNLAGAALAATLLPLAGAGTVMLLSPATYVISIAALAAIRPRQLTSPDPVPARRRGRLREGAAHLRSSPELAAALLLSAAVSMIGMGALQTGLQAVVLSGASDPAQEARVLGWLAGALAVGGIGSQLHVAGLAAPTPRTLAVWVAVLAAGLGAAAAVPLLAVILAAALAASWSAYGHQGLAQSLNQRAPDDLKGRISGIWFAAGSGGKALAAPASGALAQALGPRIGLIVSAVLLVLAIGGVAALVRRLARRGGTEPSPGGCVPRARD